MARPKKNPTGEAGSTGDAGASTTASSGNNASRRSQKRLSLSGRIGAMERTLDQQGRILQRIADRVS